MDQIIQKRFSNKLGKKSEGNITTRKKRSTTILIKDDKESVTKADLQRGKLPLNWNSYVKQATGSGNKTSKYSKQLTKLFVFSRKVKFSNAASLNMTPLQGNANREPSTGRCVAIDCEMVGVGDGREHMLARISVVDENGMVIYDTFVKPQQRVIDYRTVVSGVRPADMTNGKEFEKVQMDVHNLIKGKLLIGHALKNDLKVLYLSHPKRFIRDTSRFKKFREEVEGRTPSLRFLASQLLGIQIQQGEHSSVEDARAAMALYMKYRNTWESDLRTSSYKHVQQ